MPENHVERLETRIRELEATVSGLTEELVDTKDRLEHLERDSTAEAEPADGDRTDAADEKRPPADGETRTEPDAGSSLAARPPEENENGEAGTDRADESSRTARDDIIVA